MTHRADVLMQLEDGHDVHKTVAFRRMETSKQRRFSGVIAVANHLKRARLLDFSPFFLFPVVSHLGYMNTDCHRMCKWFKTVFNQSDGIAFSVIKARYEKQVKNALCFEEMLSQCMQQVESILTDLSKDT